MEFWIDLFWRLVIVAAVTVVITFGWTFASTKLAVLNKPYRLTEAGGVIRPWPPIWLLMGGFTALVCAGGLWAGVAEPGMVWVSVLCLAILAPLALFGVLMGLPTCQVSWNEQGISGPTASLGFGRREVSWANITRAGTSISGCYFLEDHEGGRVYWSYAYVGHHHLWNALIARRPELLEQVKRAVAAGG